MSRLQARTALCVFAAAVAFALGGCTSTPDAVASYGADAHCAIVSWETWDIDGVPESVLLRGRDASRPVVLLLHGGPGVSETALFRYFDAALEDYFVMAYWDQPGAGRSYTPEALLRGLDMERMLADMDLVVERLRARFRRDKVVIIGHSWGSALGVLYAQRHPEKVSLYVGTGQVASMPAGERASYAFASGEARRRGDAGATAELVRIGTPPHSVDEMLVSRRHVERYGGTSASGLSTAKLILAALSTSEAGLWDLFRFGAGNDASLKVLWPEFSRLDLLARVPGLSVPVLLLQGASDHVTPTPLALQWLSALRAPCKKALVFDGAAHNLPFEQPAAFVAGLARHADALITKADPSCNA